MNAPQAIAFDEFGRPFIILKEQEKKRRLTGLDAQKVGFQSHVNNKLICTHNTLVSFLVSYSCGKNSCQHFKNVVGTKWCVFFLQTNMYNVL